MRFALRAKDNNGQLATHYVVVEKIQGMLREDDELRIVANGQVLRLSISATGFVNINPHPDTFLSNDVRLMVHFGKINGVWIGLRDLADHLRIPEVSER